MALQKGLIKLKGTMGDITFYRTKEGYAAREKGGVDGNRIATDPAFQRTRENGAEFGRAGKAGKVLRTAFRPLLIQAKDKRMVGRLTKEMVLVIQADSINERGKRNVIDGEAELLNGFEFNALGTLGTSLFAPYQSSIDRVSGELTVTFDPFIPSNMVVAPPGTTHFKIMSGGAAIDFENETYEVGTSETAILPWTGASTLAINLVNTVSANSTHPLFLTLGITYYQEVNGFMYPMKNGSFNPLSIVAVSGL